MECNRTLLSAYVDDELDPASSVALAAHLKTCTTCQQDMQDLRQLTADLTDPVLRYPAPSHLRHRIQTDLEAARSRAQQENQVVAQKPWPWPWLRLGPTLILATGSGAALVFSALLYLSLPNAATLTNQEIVASHYRSLLANHIADVASSDQHTVRPWFTGKLDYVPPVQDFADQGFTLTGGRLDYIHQRTVAALVYRHGNHVINVFVWPDPSRQTPTSSVVQGFHLLQWADEGMVFSAVSDASDDALQQLRRLMEQHNPANLR